MKIDDAKNAVAEVAEAVTKKKFFTGKRIAIGAVVALVVVGAAMLVKKAGENAELAEDITEDVAPVAEKAKKAA